MWQMALKLGRTGPSRAAFGVIGVGIATMNFSSCKQVELQTKTPQKKIALLGCTGGCGRHVLHLALERGHSVRALVRDPSKLSKEVAAHAGLELVVGDASKAESIADLTRGTDVVVSCLGGRSRSDTIVSTTVRSLLTEITKNSNQQRLVAMTSIGCGGTSPLVKFGLQAMFGFTMIGDLNVADKLLLDSPIRSQTVIVRPPRIDDAPVGAKGKYVGTVEFPRGSPIMCAMTQADVAAFIVDAAERAEWDGKAVQLYSAI